MEKGFHWTFLLAIVGATLLHAPAAGSAGLTNAQQVLAFVPSAEALSNATRLQGCIAYEDPTWDTAFLADETGGVFIDLTAITVRPRFADTVEVTGHAIGSGFAPIVVVQQVTALPRRPLPPPKLVTMNDLRGGRQDSQWIQMEAVISSVAMVYGHLRLQFSVSEQLLAFIPDFSGPLPTQLIDARVRLQGVCGTRFNPRGQLIGYRIFIQYLANVQVLEPALPEPFAAATQPLTNALSFRSISHFGHQIKVAGVVTHRTTPNSLVLQDATGAAHIELADPTERFQPGDRLEVLGFPAVGQASPKLFQARTRSLGSGPRPTPEPVNYTNAPSWDWDARLVRVEGELVERIDQGGSLELVLQPLTGMASNLFRARLPGRPPRALMQSLEPGCHLALTGICDLQIDEDQEPQSMILALSGPGDIQVTRTANWFSPRHLLPLLGVIIVLSLAWGTRGFWREFQLKRRYQVIFDHASDLVFTQAIDGRFTSVNLAGERLTGFTLAQLRTRSLDSMIPPAQIPTYHEWWQQVCAGQATPPQELELIGASGNRFWVEINSHLIHHGNKMDYVESIARDISQRHRAEALQQGQREVLELLATGSPLPEVLTRLTRFIESQSPGLLCSVLLVDADGKTLRHGAAPSLPDAYNRLIDGLRSGEGVGSCGTAVARRQPVIVTDIARDPLWADFREMAAKFHLGACWSTPLLAHSNEPLGTFAVYSREPRAPGEEDLEVVELASSLARIAIERKHTDDALRSLGAFQKEILDAASFSILSTSSQGCILSVNRAAEKTLGYPAGELLGQPLVEKLHDPVELERRAQALPPAGFPPSPGGFTFLTTRVGVGCTDEQEWTYRCRDGRRAPVLVTTSCLTNGEGTITGYLFVAADLTLRKQDEQLRSQLELQLRQSQKMEAVGRLAGGIAHDFNNVLAAIMGNAELLGPLASRHPGMEENVTAILKASARARDLVRLILSFSRGASSERRPLDLETVLLEALQLVRSTLPATIEIHPEFQTTNEVVLANETEIHQVLINLCANAAYAMRGQAGHLKIALCFVPVGAPGVGVPAGLAPGRYARITVTDTGRGMDPATVERIFEPFFTTKPPGEGTGIGLAVVHGIVRSHEGQITVASQPGIGTRFTIHLPASPPCPAAPVPDRVPPPPVTGHQRLLLVDDEPAITLVTAKLLDRLGFSVTAFNNPLRAWNAFSETPDSFDIVLTDFTMPQMTGTELAGRMRDLRPALPILLATGYQNPIDPAELARLGIRQILEKPFDSTSLANALLLAMASRSAPPMSAGGNAPPTT